MALGVMALSNNINTVKRNLIECDFVFWNFDTAEEDGVSVFTNNIVWVRVTNTGEVYASIDSPMFPDPDRCYNTVMGTMDLIGVDGYPCITHKSTLAEIR